MTIYALLIGINSYKSSKIKDLYGCENDVDLMNLTLQERYAVDEQNIKCLLNKQATKAAIVESFQQHFSQAQKGDTVIFYFSGHGSQEPASPEFWKIDTNQKLETLVCYDSEVDGVTQLANKELRYLISQLPAELAQIVLIIDSCHSGHISRYTDTDDTIETRQVSLVNTPREPQDFIFYQTAQQQGWDNYINNFPQAEHILLSACRENEQSQEKQIDGERHGVFTYSLCNTLNTLQYSLSYYNLLNRVRPLTRKHNKGQTPQIETAQDDDINQEFLGSAIQPVKLHAYYDNYAWWIDAGLVHDLHKDDQITIYNSDQVENKTPLTTTSIEKISSGRCKLDEDHLNMLDRNHVYFAQVTHKNIQKLRFIIDADEYHQQRLREALQTLYNGQSPSIFIEENKQSPEYLVTAKNNQYYISLATDREAYPLFEPTNSARDVLYWLEKLKRWQQKLELNNNDIDENSVQLVIEDRDNKHIYIDEDITLSYKEGTKKCDHNKDKYGVNISLEVRCNKQAMPKKPQYCALLLFDSTNAAIISLLDNDEKLTPHPDGKPPCKTSYKEGKTVRIYVDKSLLNRGVTETTDYIKLIVSDEPFATSIMEQKGLKPYVASTHRGSPTLRNLLEQEMHYRNTRGDFNLAPPKHIPRWFTKTIELKLEYQAS